jgi:hypothetical protein
VHSIPNIFYQVDEPDLETLRACVAEGIADADAGRIPTPRMYMPAFALTSRPLQQARPVDR